MNLRNLFNNKKNITQESILDHHPDGIIILNIAKCIVFWNKKASEIFGFSEEEVLGHNIALIVYGGIEEVYRTIGEEKSTVIKARTREDNEVFVEMTASKYNEAGQLIISVRNVTKRQSVLDNILDDFEKTKKATIAKNSHLAGLSHDLKTPLHSIIGFSQALSDGLGGELSEKQQKYLTIINRNAGTILSLISSMIDIAKLESGKMVFQMKNFDINTAIGSVVGEASHKAAEKRLSFVVDMDDLVKKNCYTDDNMIQQALRNILDNAVKFTDTGSVKLKISHPDLDYVRYQGIMPPIGHTDKSYLLFTVSDTGMGIPEDELNNIFNEYRKVDRNSKKYVGAGLGLAITKRIIEELGGVIWVESEVKQGSTFSFIIPIERDKNVEL